MQAGCKGPGQSRACRVDRLEPAMVEVAEKIAAAIFAGPGELSRRKRPAGDAGGGIMVDRSPEARVGRRAMFDGRPAVIGARAAFIDFFRDSADIVDEQAAGFALHGKGERVA